MKTVVCVPYRAAGPERIRNWRYTKKWWRRVGWPIYEGDDTGEEKFAVGRSRNKAAEAAGDWDVAVFTDTDMVPAHPDQARQAAKTAYETNAYTVLYSELHYLNKAATEKVCAGERMLDPTVSFRAVGLTWISSFAVSRTLWDDLGGFDNRFHGYGGEDLAFYFAASTIGGSARTPGLLFHLDHPDDKPANSYDGNWTIVNKYSGATGDVPAMRKVLEGKT